MSVLWYRVPLILAAACVLFACSSPTQSVTFKPPAGWEASPSLFGFQAWHPSDNKQTLVLFRFPVAANVNQALSQSNFRQFNANTRQRIKICGNQPAVFLSGTGTGSQGDQNVEMIITTVKGATYMAIYARDRGLHPNSQAETAIRSLCPKPS